MPASLEIDLVSFPFGLDTADTKCSIDFIRTYELRRAKQRTIADSQHFRQSRISALLGRDDIRLMDRMSSLTLPALLYHSTVLALADSKKRARCRSICSTSRNKNSDVEIFRWVNCC